MADRARYPDAGKAHAPDSPPGTPGWVKLLGVGIVVVILLVVAVMVLAGGEHGPGLHTGANAQTPAASGLVTPAGVGGPAEAGAPARTVEIATLDTMAFDPPTIGVAAGETVTFVVTNSGTAVHEFTLGDAAMQQEHAEAMAHIPAGMAHELPNSITLQPGDTKHLTWRFGDAALEYGCHEPGHYDAGMRGRITVG